jgi:hypothetical protein
LVTPTGRILFYKPGTLTGSFSAADIDNASRLMDRLQ